MCGGGLAEQIAPFFFCFIIIFMIVITKLRQELASFFFNDYEERERCLSLHIQHEKKKRNKVI
jgi:hypothetical protein